MPRNHKEQSKYVGSIYINTKEKDPKVMKNIRKMIDYLQDNRAYFSISLRNEDGDFDKYFGGVNTFKEKSTDPDFYIKKAEILGQKTRKAKPEVVEDNDDDDDFPL